MVFGYAPSVMMLTVLGVIAFAGVHGFLALVRVNGWVIGG